MIKVIECQDNCFWYLHVYICSLSPMVNGDSYAVEMCCTNFNSTSDRGEEKFSCIPCLIKTFSQRMMFPK